MRTRAFGPTQGKTLPTPSGAGRRPVTNLASLQSDSEPDFTATPRPQTQPYAFTPISQLPGGSGAPSTGEVGGEAPPSGDIRSAPLLSPSALNLATLQRRASPNRDTGPNDTQQALDIAGKGLKGLKGGIDTADFLKKAFGDAGFMNPDALIAPITEFLQNGGGSMLEGLDPSKFNFSAPEAGAALNPADFTFDMGSLNKLLPDLFGGESGAAGTAAGAGAGAESMSSTLASAAPYINAALAALRIGQFATDSNLQDNQKAVGAAGAGLGALAPIAAGAAASAAGVGTAAAGATAAAPVAMILAQIASAIMDAMYDVPHATREALDYFHSRGAITGAAEDVDRSFTLDDLGKNLLRNTSGTLGGGYPGQHSAFVTELTRGGQRFAFGKPNNYYPTITLADLLADPQHASLSWQHGLSNQYLDPTNQHLTKLLRSRLDLLGRAQKGDPEARVAVELARARYAAYVKRRAEIEANYQDTQRRQSREMVDVNAGDSGDAGP